MGVSAGARLARLEVLQTRHAQAVALAERRLSQLGTRARLLGRDLQPSLRQVPSRTPGPECLAGRLLRGLLSWPVTLDVVFLWPSGGCRSWACACAFLAAACSPPYARCCLRGGPVYMKVLWVSCRGTIFLHMCLCDI